jgi:Ca2+/Na+ antiporter
MAIPTIDPVDVGVSGLAWLLFSYGYILFYASNLISEGSDLLLLVPSLAGLVGGVVLPFLGAVPDGTIMLFSGLGNIEKAQETLSVGVGALAGSTIMLLTVPWALSVYRGRVDFDDEDDMEPRYKQPKLTSSSFSENGVALSTEVHHGAKMMLLTTLPYFLIQVPAFFLSGDRETVSEGEKNWALAGFVICIVFFILYLYTQVKMSNDTSHKLRRMAVIKETLKKGALSLCGALQEEVIILERRETIRRASMPSDTENAPLTGEGFIHQPSAEISEFLKGILGDAFRAYDIDGNGNLNKKEFKIFLTDFHESIDPATVDSVFDEIDTDGSGTIEYDEFIAACYTLIKSNETKKIIEPERQSRRSTEFLRDTILNNDEEEEEEEEVPEDLNALSPKEQQRAIMRRAFSMLIIGTAIVLIFSDPMVEVLSEIAARANIPPFYVSFVLAPVAANASEVIASQYYAAKKTRKTITVALTALEGAASMNNTFCLSIFMGLIYFRGLAWQFSAETIAIVSVQLLMCVLAHRSKMSTSTGFLVLSLFPLSVMFVALLEYCGLD